uniref:tetrahydrofolate synthase n=1 Tax=Trichobilharzia regenti TaxID=157069 RepID=A0AA85JP18_TRIRE|nr:unnamed protein product [Trichobilharzia regenti]
MSLRKIFPHFTRSYQDALNELNKCIKSSNHYLICSNPKFLRQQRHGLSSIYCYAMGIEDCHLNDLRVIHVTGSKGKGSVCSVIENVLRQSGLRTGFLSSPHLVNIEERIRINGKPISRDHFASVFWSVHDTLKEFTKNSPDTPVPSFLHYIFVMACKAFIDEKVDVGIFEVGIGGRYDHTNIFKQPYVTVVTSLALEHTDILGDSIGEIAWRKAGIFKHGSSAVVSHDQSEEAMNIFVKEAEQVGCPLYIAPKLDDVLADWSMIESTRTMFNNTKLTDNQLLNLSVSLSAISLWFEKANRINGPCKSIGLQPTLVLKPDSTILKDALSARWPGRWQIVVRKNITYFLDGAHTVESLQSAIRWFHSESLTKYNVGPTVRILIFTVIGPRDPKSFLQYLWSCTPPFDMIVFTNPHDGQFDILPSKESHDELCFKIWSQFKSELNNTDKTSCQSVVKHMKSISDFLNWLHQKAYFSVEDLQSYSSDQTSISDNLVGNNAAHYCHIFVTGSLYMVGRILKEIKEPV